VAADLAGSVAVVIGASKGIGAGTAVTFARAGAAVVLDATGLRADATDPDSMAEVVEVAVSTYGGRRQAGTDVPTGTRDDPVNTHHCVHRARCVLGGGVVFAVSP
jgi:NAD(P)-dependent dehydrogenase (short-subunit alcohol dehydrogenase family)